MGGEGRGSERRVGYCGLPWRPARAVTPFLSIAIPCCAVRERVAPRHGGVLAATVRGEPHEPLFNLGEAADHSGSGATPRSDASASQKF